MSLSRNQTPFQRSRDSSIQDGNLHFENVINNLICTFFNDRIQFLQRLKLRHTSVHSSKRLCYYLANCARNEIEVAMRESFLLPLQGIGVCVNVHTIQSLAKKFKISVWTSLSVNVHVYRVRSASPRYTRVVT